MIKVYLINLLPGRIQQLPGFIDIRTEIIVDVNLLLLVHPRDIPLIFTQIDSTETPKLNKGIKYKGEVIIRKEGKRAAGGKK